MLPFRFLILCGEVPGVGVGAYPKWGLEATGYLERFKADRVMPAPSRAEGGNFQMPFPCFLKGEEKGC